MAGSGTLGEVKSPAHPLMRAGNIHNYSKSLWSYILSLFPLLPGNALVWTGASTDNITMGFIGCGVCAVSAALLQRMNVMTKRGNVVRDHGQLFTQGYTQPQWKYLLNKVTEDCDDARLKAGLKTAGVTWRQLCREIRPRRNLGYSLTAKDVRMLFAALKGEVVSDYMALAYAVRGLDPLDLSTKNYTGPSEYFVTLAQDITGVLQSDVPIKNSTETSTLFRRMIGDIAYTTGAVSVPQFVLMGAHLMKYHTNALTGTEVADHMLGSIKAYLRGDLNVAYREQVAALEQLERRDGTTEGGAVSALHHLSMAELICESVKSMLDEGSKPYDTLIRQGSIHAETAVEGLSLVQSTGHVDRLVGTGMLMGRAQNVLHAMRLFA